MSSNHHHQNEKKGDATTVSSSSTSLSRGSSHVPNLADLLGDDVGTVDNTNTNVNTTEATQGSTIASSSKNVTPSTIKNPAPSHRALMASSPAATSTRSTASSVATIQDRRRQREEEDRRIKQREREARMMSNAAASAATATTGSSGRNLSGSLHGGSTHVPNLAELLAGDNVAVAIPTESTSNGRRHDYNTHAQAQAPALTKTVSGKRIGGTTSTTLLNSSVSGSSHHTAGYRSSSHVPNLASKLRDDHDESDDHDFLGNESHHEFGHDDVDDHPLDSSFANASFNYLQSSSTHGSSTSNNHNHPPRQPGRTASYVPNLAASIRDDQFLHLEQVPESPTKGSAAANKKKPAPPAPPAPLQSLSTAHSSHSVSAQVEARVQAVGLLFDDDEYDGRNQTILINDAQDGTDTNVGGRRGLSSSGVQSVSTRSNTSSDHSFSHDEDDYGGHNVATTTTTAVVDRDLSIPSHHHHVPESADAVRERVRAAAVVMSATDIIDVDVEEQQQLKNREQEERDFIMNISSSASATGTAKSLSNSTEAPPIVNSSSIQNFAPSHKSAQAALDNEIKSKAAASTNRTSSATVPPTKSIPSSSSTFSSSSKSLSGSRHGLSASQRGAKNQARLSAAISIGSNSSGALSEQDMKLKSRGGLTQGAMAVAANDVIVPYEGDAAAADGSAQVQTERPPSTATPTTHVILQPGALAVADGRAENRAKASLTEQPDVPDDGRVASDHLELGEVSMPLSYADVSPPAQMVDVESGTISATNNGTSVTTSEPNDDLPSGRHSSVQTAVVTPVKSGLDDDQQPHPHRKWICLGFGVLIVAIAAGVGGGLAASGSSPSPPASSTSQDSPTAFPTMPASLAKSAEFQRLEGEFSGSLSNQEDFDTAGSPQYKALSWIADQDTISTLDDMEQLTQRYILAVFYYALGGETWVSDFQSSPPSQSSWLNPDTSECDWEGITCGGDANQSCLDDNSIVCQVRLQSEFNLQGNIPSEIQNLGGLRALWVENNIGLTGVDDIYPQLMEFSLENTGIDETVLPLLFQMTNLELISLKNNAITSTIPEEVQSMTNLKSLDLSENNFSGTITSHFHTMTSLQSLGLANNNLRGRFEDLIHGSTDIINLIITDNQFSGSIPSSVSKFPRLDRIEADDNQLTGSIPAELWSSPTLARLWVESNPGIVGPISEGIQNAQKLQNLNLGKTNIEGTLPSEIGNMTQLIELTIGPSLLSGPIPTEIGSVSKLALLSMPLTFLSGPLPSEIGQLDRLKVLELNENNAITGTIPTEYGNLDSLEVLSLYNNPNLMGSIPSAICDLANLVQIRTALTPLECTCDKCFDQ